MFTDFELMTERERVEVVLPKLWDWVIALDPDTEFSELQLASIAYNTATRCSAKWDGSIPFLDFVASRLKTNIWLARENETFNHPAEMMLNAVTEGGAA